MYTIKHHFKFAEMLTRLLDDQFKFGRFSFGLDPLLGMIPGIGDVLSFVISAYIVWIGIQMQLPGHKIALMVWNITIDFLFGLIPFLGDGIDFIYKANRKNMEILQKHLNADVVESSS